CSFDRLDDVYVTMVRNIIAKLANMFDERSLADLRMSDSIDTQFATYLAGAKSDRNSQYTNFCFHTGHATIALFLSNSGREQVKNGRHRVGRVISIDRADKLRSETCRKRQYAQDRFCVGLSIAAWPRKFDLALIARSKLNKLGSCPRM